MAKKKERKKRKIKILSYFIESKDELKKVTWPTLKEAYHLTVVVVIISVSVALFLGFFDFILSGGLNIILK